MANHFDYSVVIPCRNGDRTLGRALAHIGQLSPGPREVVVVDDASTDGTRATAVAAGARVVHFTEPVGAPRVRNTGAAAANSTWLLFVDSDCYVTPGGFLEAVQLLHANDRLAGVMGVFATAAPARFVVSDPPSATRTLNGKRTRLAYASQRNVNAARFFIVSTIVSCPSVSRCGIAGIRPDGGSGDISVR